MSPIQVMIVDDHPVVLAGLKLILQGEADINICAEAESGAEALEKAAQCLPHVILMDVRMPGMDGIQATLQLRELLPQAKVILLTAHGEQHLAQAVEAGAHGYLVKGVKREELARAIRAANSNQLGVDAAFSLPTDMASLGKRLALTPRQRQIIHLVAQGMANKEIAYRLHLSHTTVKREVRSIYDKLGAVDRAEAVALAYRYGLLFI